MDEIRRMTAAGTVTACVLLTVAVLANCFQLNSLSDITDMENDVVEVGIPSSDYCSDNYPYTFSKCLRLCSPDLNVTCLDDQLCYCNSEEGGKTELKESSVNAYLGVNMKGFCSSSYFCDDLCRYDGRLSELAVRSHGSIIVTGALCNYREVEVDTEIESCVCGLG